MCVYASLCDCVCISLLLQLVLGFCLSVYFILFYFCILLCLLSLVNLFLVWLLSAFFLSFFLLFLFLMLFYFNNFLNFIYLFFFCSFFFSPFSSELCGWQGLCAPAGCQACASEAGEPSSVNRSTRDLLAPCNIKQQKLSQRSPSQHKDPAPLNNQEAIVLDTLCQTTSKTGTQAHPLAERLPKIIIRSQTPQNTPPDMVLPTRKTRSSLIHQNTGTSPLHQEAYTTHWNNLSHWGQTPKAMGTTNRQPVKRRPQTQ